VENVLYPRFRSFNRRAALEVVVSDWSYKKIIFIEVIRRIRD